MKLRGWDRIVLFIGALLIAAIGVSIFLVSLRISQLVFPAFGGEEFIVSKLIISICGFFLFVYAVYLLSISLSYHPKKKDFVVQETSGGELRISINALDSLVRKVMAGHTEMNLKDMLIENIKDSVLVDIKIAIAENVSIPLAVASVQKEIRQHLLSATGIDVKEVRVSVQTADAAVEASPFMMHEADVIVSPEDGKQFEIKKKHKLFSKKVDFSDDQSLIETESHKQGAIKDKVLDDILSAQQHDEGIDKHAGV